MNNRFNPWTFGFKAALGAIAAIWLVRAIGVILWFLALISIATYIKKVNM